MIGVWCNPKQRVWSGNLRSCGSFLHSPLLEELKSLQVMLQPRLPFEATTAVKILEPQNMVSIELTTPKGVYHCQKVLVLNHLHPQFPQPDMDSCRSCSLLLMLRAVFLDDVGHGDSIFDCEL